MKESDAKKMQESNQPLYSVHEHCDQVYVHKRDWISAQPILESLRVEVDMLATIEDEAIERHRENYPSLRVRRFLEGLRKDLKR